VGAIARFMKSFTAKLLKFIRSAVILLIFLALGKGISYYSGLPIPGSIFGLLLLFGALSCRLIDRQWVMPASNFLLNNMTLFFVPVGVGLLQYSDLLSQYWLAILASSLVSTLAVLITVGWCYQRLAK